MICWHWRLSNWEIRCIMGKRGRRIWTPAFSEYDYVSAQRRLYGYGFRIFWFFHDEELWKEVTHVSGPGECIFKDGLEEGAQKGRTEGRPCTGKSGSSAWITGEYDAGWAAKKDQLRSKIWNFCARWHKIAAKSTSIVRISEEHSLTEPDLRQGREETQILI